MTKVGKRVVFLLFMALPTLALASYRSLGAVRDVHWHDNRLTLDCSGPRVQISVLAPDLARVRLAPRAEFAPNLSHAVVVRDWPGASCELAQDAEKKRSYSKQLSSRSGLNAISAASRSWTREGGRCAWKSRPWA